MLRLAWISATSLVLLAACSQAPQPVSERSSEQPASSASESPHSSAEMPAGHPPLGGGDGGVVPPGVPITGTPPSPEQGGLAFVEQAGWDEQVPKNSTRHRQYMLPRASGDPEDGELLVFYFHGGGGTAEMNIARWCSMFAQDDGSSSREAAKVTEEESDGLKLTHLDLTGRYVAEVMPGEGVRHNKPEMRMLATIVEYEGGGPYFIKAVAPKATMDRWEESYFAFIADLR